MTRVPRAPESVKGLINLRGQIVTAIDLGRLLGLPAATPAAINVVIRSDWGMASFLVDDMGEVERVSGGFEPVPSNTPAAFRSLLRGVVPRDGELLLVLDPDAVLGAPPLGESPFHSTGMAIDDPSRVDGRSPWESTK